MYTFFFYLTMPKSDNLVTENYTDSHLSFIVLYSDNLRHSGMDLWVFPSCAFFFKELGDGEKYQRIPSWIDFCFALSFTSWLCQMQCVSHAVSLFREPQLSQLVSIQTQGKEDKILSACWDCKSAIRLKAMYWRKRAITDIIVDWNLPV